MLRLITAFAFGLFADAAEGAEVVNIDSARHYDTDVTLYRNFKDKTEVTLKVNEGNSNELLSRVKREVKRIPADILITVDAGRPNKAEKQGGAG